jgi:preprotein translocase subunit SecA
MHRSENSLVSHEAVRSSLLGNFQPLSCLKNRFGRLIGAPIKNHIGEYWEIVKRVNAIDLSSKTDSQLAERTWQLAQLLKNVQVRKSAQTATTAFRDGTWEMPSPELEIEMFAIVSEAARRAVGLDPFDVQLIAGMAMARGCIAELPTGEGKTLAAVFTACLRSLTGRGVHVLTFNDYLARRDAAWMGPIYRCLGLTVGCIQEEMSPPEKRAAYSCNITYASAKEVGFDFLRDQIAYDRDSLVHRPFHCAIVDEADSILIDEARIPLVISGADDRASRDTSRLASLVKVLTPDRDFEIDDTHRNVFLTDGGIERAESMLGCGSLYIPDNQSLLEAVYCALHAQALLRCDVDYIVCDGQIKIIDEYTGRVVDKRHWPDGLQAAVEAKEGLLRKTQGRILGSITLQHYFRLYPALSGMTATAQSSAGELLEFYGIQTVVVPPHTASIRIDHPDVVFARCDAKRRGIFSEILEVHAIGRPILVGTASVKESEELAGDLLAAGIPCNVLNAKNDELEASILAKAGMPGAVTISTNMAGRGVDIKLGGNDEKYRDAVASMGGLYVMGTNRHESLRIDRQLRGRAGRQGDPGATRFFISLEDDLFERYGLTKMLMARHRLTPQDEVLPQGSIQREIVHAQRVIEGQNFDIRRSLCKFSSLVELQRQIIQARRQRNLLLLDELKLNSVLSKQSWEVSSGQITDEVNSMGLSESEREAEPSAKLAIRQPALYEKGLQRFGPCKMAELEHRGMLFHLDRLWSDHLAWIQDMRDSIHLVNLGGREPIEEFRKWATMEFLKVQDAIDEAVVLEITTMIQKDGPVDLDLDLERLRGPSSTWTYLVNENPFGGGTEMLKTKNIGFGSMAALVAGPLFLWMLHQEARKNKALAKRADEL